MDWPCPPDSEVALLVVALGLLVVDLLLVVVVEIVVGSFLKTAP
jgi:hypothetical protein